MCKIWDYSRIGVVEVNWEEKPPHSFEAIKTDKQLLR